MIELFSLDTMDTEEHKAFMKELVEVMKKTKSYCHGHYVLDYFWILQNIPKDVKTVADAGGGLGALQFLLAEKGYTTTNIDRMPYGHLIAPKDKRVQYIQTTIGDTTINYKDVLEYDCIVSCSALEHNLPDYFRDSLKSIKQMLKPGGRAIITLPFTDTMQIRGNQITFTEATIKAYIEEAGLKLISTKSNYDQFPELRKQFAKKEIDIVPGGVVVENV